MTLAGGVTQQPHERPEPLPQESVSPTSQGWHQKVTPSPLGEVCYLLWYRTGVQGTAFWDYGKFIRGMLRGGPQAGNGRIKVVLGGPSVEK